MSTINLKQLDLSSIPGSAKWDLVWFLSRKHSTLPRKQGVSNLSFHTQLFSNTSFQAISPSPNLLNFLVRAKKNINRITSTSCFTKSFHVFFSNAIIPIFAIHPSDPAWSSHSPRVMVNQIGGVEVVIDIIEVALHFKDIRCRKVHCDGCTFRQIDTVTQVVEAPTQKRWEFPKRGWRNWIHLQEFEEVFCLVSFCWNKKSPYVKKIPDIPAKTDDMDQIQKFRGKSGKKRWPLWMSCGPYIYTKYKYIKIYLDLPNSKCVLGIKVPLFTKEKQPIFLKAGLS